MSTQLNFSEFVLDWWNEFLDNADEDTLKRIMENEFVGEEETIDDYIPEDAESVKEWLAIQDDAEKIYTTFFGYEATDCLYDNLPDTATFLADMFMQAADGELTNFQRDFILDMASHAEGYENPKGFFEALQHGCQSGMIGMLIYNSDCKHIYVENIDDMEEYVADLEESLGEPIRPKEYIPHYTFVCWLCYEELGFSIARTLFEDF